ncbi:ArsA-related P-loop ATPase [Streptomyces sp. B1866]|uniref:ArsA family ATPase n=1 Tax=Streptomyces sp. B1866 TaxID=3075431 RepID=UPI00288FDE96|nr:ArsA-related P-loop ATPase [Streptomyces sp. B1866]MDT3399045.1 ArsA-related P-loop ATPase [Streptomyces sp. B1866]
MRTVLVTGGGGAGRTTVAAATALAAARAGWRTLLLTADRDGTAEALLGLPARGYAHGGDEQPAARPPWTPPAEAAPGLWAARLATGDWLRAELAALQERGRDALDLLGAAPLDGEELAEVPGATALALLRALRVAHAGPEDAADPAEPADLHAGTGDGAGGAAPRSGARWHLLVVDAPPLADTVAALALPGQLRRYLRRLVPPERQAARALRPVLAQLAGVPMPAQKLYEAAGRWEVELAAAQDAVESAATTLRIVVDPGPPSVRALRAARAGLALHGCRVEAVVANRLLPTGSADPWLAAVSGAQQAALKELKELCEAEPAVPVRELPHLGREPRLADGAGGPYAGVHSSPYADGGEPGLSVLAAAAGAPGDRPGGPAADPWTVEDRLAADGELVWRLPLPGADREGLGVLRRGDELIVTTGPYHRVLPLPSALRRCTVAGARLRDGELRVSFAPDLALWPTRS